MTACLATRPLRLVLLLAVVGVIGVGCNVIPINIPDPTATSDGGAPQGGDLDKGNLDAGAADAIGLQPDMNVSPAFDAGWPFTDAFGGDAASAGDAAVDGATGDALYGDAFHGDAFPDDGGAGEAQPDDQGVSSGDALPMDDAEFTDDT
jgi:hypothetical protein